MIHHLLTSFRVIISPFMMYFLYKKHIKISVFLSIFAIFCDIFDGFIARFLNKQSRFGALFDVFADKIFLYMSITGFLLNKTNNKIIIILIMWIIRDSSLFYFFLHKKNDFKSLISGKIYTAFQFFFILSLSFFWINNFILKSFFIMFFILGLLSIKYYMQLFLKNE